MKKKLFILLPIFVVFAFVLTSCNSDTQGPKIYLLGADGDIVQDGDTTVLLYTKFVDPGVKVEDNASHEENIILENNASEELSLTSSGYLKYTGEYEITYTATDEESNVSSIIRKLTVLNISQPFVNSYTTTRTALHLVDTSYRSSVTADTKIPGRLRFPKVYQHTWDGARTYFRVNADLYDPANLSDEASDAIAYMGTQSNKEIPYFANMSYEEGIESITNFTYLRIDAQEYSDSTNTHRVFIQGVVEEGTDLPLSHIEYIGGSSTILKIVLELNVTKNGIVDRVTEVYTPND